MSTFKIFVYSLLFFFVALDASALDIGAYSPSSAPRPRTMQFESSFAGGYDYFSSGVCNATLQDYRDAYHAPAGSELASYLFGTCVAHEECIIQNLPTQWQANLNSAAVVLGLMPTILANIGPSIAEISLLSAHRPLLSFLISMGAPAVLPTRILEYSNPIQALVDHKEILVLNSFSKSCPILLSTSQYVIAIGSIINVVMTSVQLGDNSILTWGCTTNFLPIVWTTLACVIHLVAAASYSIARQLSGNQSSGEVLAAAVFRMLQNKQTEQRSVNDSISLWLKFLARMWKHETTLCAKRDKSDDNFKMPYPAIFLNVVAGVFGFVHVTFGTIVFSSLQFVNVWAALHYVLWRYAVSTVVCRFILLIELEGLKSQANNN